MKALDLFCCAGGATKGLQQAGYHVTGVDIRPQPRYCGDVFHQDDAMAWLRGEREPLSSFDLVWASAPCQRYQRLNTTRRTQHPDLLPETLRWLRALGLPYICENVMEAAPLMNGSIVLCGSMFELPIRRHRVFEVGGVPGLWPTPPRPCNHHGPVVLISGVSRRKGQPRREHVRAEKTAAIGIDWMTVQELDQAIPPAYSQFLAEQVLAALKQGVTA